MPAHLELILPHTDADRDVSLVFVPSYLFGDGQSVLSGRWRRCESRWKIFLVPMFDAAELSLHFQANFFLELRAMGRRVKTPARLSDDLSPAS